MKKKLLLFCLSIFASISLTACGMIMEQNSDAESNSVTSENTDSNDVGGSGNGDSTEVVTHDYVAHEAVDATCDEAGNEAYYTCNHCDKFFNANKEEIAKIPVIEALKHAYVVHNAVDGTCSAAGTIEHYTCDNGCGKLFDLQYNVITDITGEYDETNHSGSLMIVATTQPNKLVYAVGESFDPTGMTVAYKCADCEGEVIDNQYLTYEYQTNGATAFAKDDTKVIVKFNDLAFELTVTVNKVQAEITNVEEVYTTACGEAPVIEATSNVPEQPIVITYFDGDNEVQATDFVAGKTYTAKISIASTDTIEGAEKTATVNVAHKYGWVSDAEDWKKLNYVCGCGEKADFYALDYQAPYVDKDNLGIDLAAFVVGAKEVQVKSVKQIVRMKGDSYVSAKEGDVVDIEYTNDGMVYSFEANTYETPTAEKPYILTLSVVYDVDGVECPIVVEAKLVDKLIQNPEDLLSVQYKGDNVANTGYYVLMKDIDVSEIDFSGSMYCFQAAYGFLGVFEGNGHTISNVNITSGFGVFGAIGDSAKIRNVTFKNINMKKGSEYSLAYATRTATLINVHFEFSVDSEVYMLTNSMNSCTLDNVSVLTDKNAGKPFLIDENANNPLPETVTLNYFTQYTVTFNTDGGNEIAPAAVTTGRKVSKPANPTKASDENYDYTFVAWLYNGAEFSFDAPITEDIELVAKWKATEKLNETEMIANAISAINALPESVTMPRDINYVPAISAAKATVDSLSEEGKAQVTNAEKLNKLVAAIQGYTTVYTPDETGVKAIPGCVPCKVMDIAVTGALSTDETQGRIFTATSGTGGNVAIQFANFPDVSAYTTIYFYVRSTSEGYLYIANNTQNGGWGTDNKNNFNSIADNYGKNNVIKDNWSLIAFDTATGYFTSEWFIGVWSNATDFNLEIGAVVGCKAAELPKEEKVEVNLAFGTKTETGETNAYGMVYTIAQEQWYIDNNNANTLGTLQTSKLANALPEGFDHFEFWVYNGTDTEYSFHLAGAIADGDDEGEDPDWGDSKDSFALKVGEWTKVTISAADIELNTQGQWYVYILGGDGQGAAKDGWKISTIYAVKA